jgi:hypothetical protein
LRLPPRDGYAAGTTAKRGKMKFSYSAVWNDTAALLKSHSPMLAAVAGVFIFLPLLLTGYLLPTPTSQTDPLGAMTGYYRDNWAWLLLGSIVNALGAMTIYRLIFSEGRVTVGQAIGGALPLLPSYVILSLIVSIALGTGFILFIVPAIYLLGRLTTSAPIMVAENRRSPLAAIGESWRRTSGRGWAVAGMIVIVALAGSILAFVGLAVLGTLLVLIAGREGVGALLLLLLNSLVTAALYVVLIVLIAAIYRALRGEPAADFNTGI